MAEYEHSHKEGSSTTAKTALGLSIGALGVELLGGLNGGGLLKGVSGGSDSAKIAQLEAQLYANTVGVNTFKEAQTLVEKQAEADSAKFDKLFDQAVKDAVNDARMEEQIKCLQKETDYKIDGLRSEMKLGFTNLGHAIEVEAERRETAVKAVKDWTGCNFVRYKKVVDADEICPKVALASDIPATTTT